MSNEQIFEYFNDRDAMTKRVKSKIHAAKIKKSERDVSTAHKLMGFDRVIEIMKGKDPKAAANDDYYSELE